NPPPPSALKTPPPLPAPPALSARQPDLEQLRPELAGDEQPIALRIVGDAVEHAVGRTFAGCEQPAQVDVPQDTAGRWRYARDVIGGPDVGEHLTFDVL